MSPYAARTSLARAFLLSLSLLPALSLAGPTCYAWSADPPTYDACMEAFHEMEVDLARLPSFINVGRARVRSNDAYTVPKLYYGWEGYDECVIEVNVADSSGSDEISKRDLANMALDVISTCLHPSDVQPQSGGLEKLPPQEFVSVEVRSAWSDRPPVHGLKNNKTFTATEDITS